MHNQTRSGSHLMLELVFNKHLRRNPPAHVHPVESTQGPITCILLVCTDQLHPGHPLLGIQFGQPVRHRQQRVQQQGGVVLTRDRLHLHCQQVQQGQVFRK